ncbi:MAG: hypothetical protein ACYS8L_10670, partial [Planctomycetota bacterium]
MAVPQTGITELSALTRAHYMGPLADNVFDATPVLQRFKKRQKLLAGGERIRRPLLYVNDYDGPYSRYDARPTQHRDVVTDVYFEWKQYSEHVT